MRRQACLMSALVFTFVSILWPARGEAQEEVDLQLVLAVDISLSMDIEEQRLQREGYVEAITSAEVMEAIRSGFLGRIAVSYVEWAGRQQQSLVVDWHRIGSPGEARAFARAVNDAPLRRARRTSISSGLGFAGSLFASNGFESFRRVIDVSGDGPNNNGTPVTETRDALLDRGIVINGLPLMLKRDPTAWYDIEHLDRYYRDCVIGGPASFQIPVREHEHFITATRQKLVLEIAGHAPPASLWPAAFSEVQSRGETDCLIGEKLWQQRMRYWEP